MPYGYAYSLWTYFRTEGDRDSRSFQPEREPSAVSCHESIWGKFEKETNGRYHVTIYPNGVLGEQGAMAEFIRTGALQMAIVPCSVPEGYDADFAIVGAPYLYDNIDHLEKQH